MQTYRSHKVVEAAPIAAAEFAEDGSGKVALVGGEIVSVPAGFIRPGKAPTEGDYLVRYQPDGYLSWSPRDKFEDGYRALDDGESEAPERTKGLAFGEALDRLKSGRRIARAGWNGKGMWLSLSGPLQGRAIPPESFWSANNADFARENGGTANVLPCITMKTADGSILMGWLASQTDMLADDWQVAA